MVVDGGYDQIVLVKKETLHILRHIVMNKIKYIHIEHMIKQETIKKQQLILE